VSEIEKLESEAAQPAGNRYRQLSELLYWSNERAWPLGVGVLLTAGLYLYQYIQSEKIPLSITSSAVITALPAMSAILIVVVLAMVLFLLLPTFILFHKLNASGLRLSDDLRFGKNDPRSTARHRQVIMRWAGGLLVMGAYCLLVGVAGASLHGSRWWGPTMLVGAVITIAAYVYFIVRGVGVKVSTDFKFACVMSAVSQVVVILAVTSALLRIAGAYVENIWWTVPLVLSELLVLWIIQLLSAMFVMKLLRHENPVGLAAVVTLIIIVLVGLFPPTGARLGGVAFQYSASGARNCTVLHFNVDSKGFDAMIDPSRPGFSRPVRVIAEVDGVYFVRPWKSLSKAVEFVPRATLAGVDGCDPELHASTSSPP